MLIYFYNVSLLNFRSVLLSCNYIRNRLITNRKSRCANFIYIYISLTTVQVFVFALFACDLKHSFNMLQVAWVTRKQIQKYQLQAHSNHSVQLTTSQFWGFFCIKSISIYIYVWCLYFSIKIQFNFREHLVTIVCHIFRIWSAVLVCWFCDKDS